MSKRVERKVTDNQNPDKVRKEVIDFFDPNTDEDLIKKHIAIEKGICDKFNEMSIDGKSFTHIKFFDDDDDYVYWSEAKRKLPPIDEHLTYTLVSEEKFD